MEQYYRIFGKVGVYIFTKKEIAKALDRENGGIPFDIENEEFYYEENKLLKLKKK